MSRVRAPVAVNSRILLNPLTGVQRYTLELLARFPEPIRNIKPPARMTGMLNQTWEQTILPVTLGKDVLWSPANTGPLAVKRQVLTVHDLVPMEHPEWYRPEFVRYFSWLLERLVHRVHHIIAVSAFTRDSIVRLLHVSPERISVIQNGVSPRFSVRPEGEIAAARQAFGLGGIPYVLYLGSIEPRKNLQRLLNAWSLAAGSLPRDLTLVVGGGRGNPRAFQRVHLPLGSDRVRFIGHVADQWVPGLLSGALAFVYPSLYEGFGFPPLESMACGTPALTSNVSSLPEVVGDAALTVDPFDEGAMATALIHLLTDETFRGDLRRRGFEQAARFSWDRSASQTWEILRACR
jgi:glycosyltransferase involved in cell wall biosynthesis